MPTIPSFIEHTNFEHFSSKYRSAQPFPYLIFDNFLPEQLALDMYSESCNLPNVKKFDRAGSYMEECTDLPRLPIASQYVSLMHGYEGMSWISNLLDMPGLIADPYIIGGGYANSFNGDILNPHIDYNWNDRLKLHRVVTAILYLTPNWQDDYGGELNFYNADRTKVVASIANKFNRLVIFAYDKTAWHGTSQITCPSDIHRCNFRLYYFTSNSTHLADDPPHRSQYYYDAGTGSAFDNRTER